MSSRKLKKQKTNLINIKSSNETPDVLVLPPKLLQKLGISLGNIDTIQKDHNVNFKDHESIKENEVNLQMSQLSTSQAETTQNSETSIMKTANLMKNSVFLSPTFSYSNSQIDLNINEDVLSSTVSDVDINNSEVENDNNATDSIAENTNHILENITVAEDNETSPQLNHKCPIKTKVQEDQDSRTSQCFDKQKDKSTNSISSTSNIKYKISVISEEIIAPDKLMEWKFLHSPSATLIPVPIDTVIRKTKPAVVTHDRNYTEHKLPQINDLNSHEKVLSNNKSINDDAQDIQTDMIVDERDISNNFKNNNNVLCINETRSLPYLDSDIVNNYVTGDPKVDSTEEDISNEIDFDKVDINKSKLIFNQENELNSENDMTSNMCNGKAELREENKLQMDEKIDLIDDVVICTPKKSNELIDKVNKVAAYLKQYLQTKKDPLKSNRRVLQCKSHIQGVEKPGGTKGHVFLQLKKESNPKTYCKTPTKINKGTSHYIPDDNLLTNADFNIDANDSFYGIGKIQKFCVCSDFGCFNYYDLKCYEHIHFWKRDNVECSSDVIFSIYYNDENLASNEKYSFEEIIPTIADESSAQSNYICFNNFEMLENEHFDSSVNITVEDSLNFENKAHVFESKKTIEKKQLEVKIPNIDENKQNPKDNDITIQMSGESRTLGRDLNIVSNELKHTVEENVSREESAKTQRMGTKRKQIDPDDSPLIQFKKTRAIIGSICEEFVADSKLDERQHYRTGDDESNEDALSIVPKEENDLVVCGICKQKSSDSLWFEHIAKEHCYLAWREGDTPLDFTNETVVHEHLTRMLDVFGNLVCSRCGIERKNTRKYLSHVNRCDITPGTAVVQLDEKPKVAKCGVCQEEVTDWFGHIGTMHNYLACREGDHSVDFDNDVAVQQYLTGISKQINGLICAKCGCRRKYVKSYFDHLKNCDGVEKRRISSKIDKGLDTSMRTIKCGVCEEEMREDAWIHHIQQEHNYLAWEYGVEPIDVSDKEVVYNYLYDLSKQINGLVCSKCGCCRKYVKSYLDHINNCSADSNSRPVDQTQITQQYLAWKQAETPLKQKRRVSEATSEINISQSKRRSLKCDMNTSPTPECSNALSDTADSSQSVSGVVKCGVCEVEMTEDAWIHHIQQEHNYLAWKLGEEPLDTNDKEVVNNHLYNISKQQKGLTCFKCGIRRKYVKLYLAHIKTCNGNADCTDDSIMNSSQLDSSTLSKSLVTEEDENAILKCGVCEKEMENRLWIHHIGEEHNYMAWKENDSPLDVNDEEAVNNHLYNISKQQKGLTCFKCGLRRKYVKLYLAHIKTCNGNTDCTDDSIMNSSQLDSTISKSLVAEEVENAIVKCGVCEKEMENRLWIRHIGEEHNYMAWKENDSPLDVNDEEAVNNHLYNISKQQKGLTCFKCGIRRKYVKLYLAHVKTCNGNTDCTDDSIMNSSQLDSSTISKSLVTEEDENAIVKCGVCEKEMENRLWIRHIGEEHNYMAWKENDSPLDVNDEEAVNNHLYNISKQQKGLTCFKCGIRRKYVKLYLAHIKTCNGNADCTDDSIISSSQLDSSTLSKSLVTEEDENAIVKCGVCEKEMENRLWIHHIGEEHNYMAWKEHDSPLDLNDYKEAREYLYNIIQKHGPLTCRKCGRRRKYAKSFLAHIGSCHGDVSVTMDTTESSFITEDTEESKVIIKCGVCQKEVGDKRWPIHMQIHNYIAWKEGETPLNINNEQSVYEHLYEMSKIYNGLTCAKCNIKKKYVKSYRTHVESCVNDVDPAAIIENQEHRESYECAVCHEVGPVREFRSHAMNKHYNVAWMVGDIPIDIKNNYAVEKYLKEYRKYKALECLKCGMTRASIAGFYAHIIVCGKTEEETEMYKSVCEICNTKYLGVYRSQHMMVHRVQEDAKLRKLQYEEKLRAKEDAVLDPSGKRRAAQKAKNVIKNFTSKTDGTISNDEEDEYKYSEDGCSSSESDIPSDVEASAEEASPDTDVDSNVSETEDKAVVSKSKKTTESVFSTTNLRRIPFIVKDPASYIAQSHKDFSETHLTSHVLFPQWLSCDFEEVPDAVLQKYMPPLKESCKVMLSSNTWLSFKRFEAKIDTGFSMFVGASIQGVSWVPGRAGEDKVRPYLAVSCHSGTDTPRLGASQLVAHPALIQIWDFKNMHRLPSFVFGLAHDFGTVWGMDWCPSGARELLPEESNETEGFVRLGLLAIACSNGSAYIFSVPHPTTIVKNEKLVYKLKPVAELRLFRDTNRKSQATAINWSNQKGHGCIMVGYSNGMTAVYDLDCDSPLLSCVEDGVKIYYPFTDDRPHTACITDVKTFATGSGGGRWSGAASASSSCGVAASLGGARGERAGATHLQLTATQLAPLPHWPAPLLVGNSDIITQAINEVEWWGVGRRLGSMGCACGCAVCARLAIFFPPLLKVMHLHPVFDDKRDIKVKARLDMIPLKVEQTSKETAEKSTLSFDSGTYEEAIKSYGIKFKFAAKLGRKDLRQNMNRPRRRSVERFPLADVTAMAFCPIPRYHKRLALATHSGIIFVVTT